MKILNERWLITIMIVVMMALMVKAVTYKNCIEYNKNYFLWVIEGSKIYGRAIFSESTSGWAGIGFRSGYEYLDPVPVDGGVDNSKMLNSLIYVGYRDIYYNHYFHEYIAGSDAVPDKIAPQLNGKGYTRSSNTSTDMNIVFERPLIMSSSLNSKYYNFKQGDNSSILFAKTNFKSPKPSGLDDMCRHNEAKILKVDFFTSHSCSGRSIESFGAIPDYITPLPQNYYDEMDRKESDSTSVVLFSFPMMMLLYCTLGFLLSLYMVGGVNN